MTKEYLIERLKEAAEEGWEKALATIEDDIAEGIEDAWYIQNILPQDYYEYTEVEEPPIALDMNEIFEELDSLLI